MTVNYRPAPRHPWPAGADDVGAAIAWTHDHGGDPARIVLIGHSAGETHVASWLASQGGIGAKHIAAAVMLLGIYDAPTADRHESNPALKRSLRAYFGANTRHSALAGLLEARLPMLFAVAEFDWPVFHRQTALLVEAMFRRRGTVPRLAWLAGHTHFSGCLLLGLPDQALDAALHALLDRVVDGREAPCAP